MQSKVEGQTQYERQKLHLFYIIQKLLSEDNLDYELVIELTSALEDIPEKFFVNYTEIEVALKDMSENFLDKLMMKLDDSQRNDDNHEINHRYFLRAEFKGISSGEAKMIDIFAMLYNSLNYCQHAKEDTCVLILDEPDMGFHPEWSRVFIKQLTDFLKSGMMCKYNYHIIMSTHSPIMLSDVPQNCIHCISKDEDNNVIVKESDKYGLISGINDILIDAFFTNSVFGEFGEKYVNEIIKQINNVDKRLYSSEKLSSDGLDLLLEECDDIKNMIGFLGEGYIKDSLNKRLNRQRNSVKELKNQ